MLGIIVNADVKRQAVPGADRLKLFLKPDSDPLGIQ
jgi:hypothetical protein